MTTLLQTPTFRRTVKRLHPNQKKDLDAAIKQLLKSPESGEQKKGDLVAVRVFKFKMTKQLTLLAYLYEKRCDTFTLLALGSHENFYRDLK